jgi:hypothetical protein
MVYPILRKIARNGQCNFCNFEIVCASHVLPLCRHHIHQIRSWKKTLLDGILSPKYPKISQSFDTSIDFKSKTRDYLPTIRSSWPFLTDNPDIANRLSPIRLVSRIDSNPLCRAESASICCDTSFTIGRLWCTLQNGQYWKL